MPSESDKLLIEQIKKGEPRSWEQLIHRYERRLQAFAFRRLNDRTLAEDVVQDTFIGFLNSLPNYDPSRELQTWLFAICAHKITDQMRKNGRKPVFMGEAYEERMQSEPDSQHRAASSDARSRERRAIEATAIARILKGMIDHWWNRGEFVRIQVLELLFVKGWGNREIATFLKINEQQVANYRFAALKKLGERMRDAGLPEDVFPELHEPAPEGAADDEG